MIKFEGDYQYIHVNTMQEYMNSQAGLKVNIGIAPSFRATMERLEKMEREWNEQKKLIDSNPAVKASYDQFVQMMALAKEIPSAT